MAKLCTTPPKASSNGKEMISKIIGIMSNMEDSSRNSMMNNTVTRKYFYHIIDF